MPYKVFRDGNQHCVHKLNADGSKGSRVSGGCHSSASDANAQMRALYAAENKEIEMDENETLEDVTEEGEQENQEEKMYPVAETSLYIPFGVTSFEELDLEEEAERDAQKVRDDTYKFAALARAIMRNPEVEDKASALRKLAREFETRVTEKLENKEIDDAVIEFKETLKDPDPKGVIERVTAAIKGLVEPKEKETPPTRDFMVWKDTKTGRYRWLARYSNNIRDEDIPPEIISKESHIRFAEMVKKGEYPYPELWMYHVPQWKWGQADYVAYDEKDGTLFTFASGLVDEGAEGLAKEIAKLPPGSLKVSHGMPVTSIARDPEDNTIIVQHQTREISPLPPAAAANKFTGFSFLKEKAMAIPDEARKTALEEVGIDPSKLDEVEDLNAADAEKAKDLELEFKEKEEGGAKAEEVGAEGAETETQDEGKEETPAEPGFEDQPPTRKEVAEAVAPIAQDLKGLQDTVTALADAVKALAQTDEEKVAEKAKETPSVSLGAMIAKSVIGKDETRVDGRTTLGKSGPKESDTLPQSDNPMAAVIGDILKEHTHGDPQRVQ